MKTVDMAEGRGPNPYYAGNFDGESDELRDLRLSLVAERDALKAENERLLAANRDCIAHYEDARAELERINALPPVMVYHGACTIDCGEHGHHNTEMLKMIPTGTKLYALGSKT